jgi:D-alanyl-D-alanine carboxypeptidase (penicillin-binding protein 5/6)
MSPVPFSGEPGAGRAQPSWFTGSWLPPRRHDRSERRFTAGLATGATALVTLAVLTVAVVTSGNSPGTGAGSLPWPAEGRTSVVVEGLGAHGDLGTRGSRTPVPISSGTKVMTTYVILRDRPLRAGQDGPLVTVDRTAANESACGHRVRQGRPGPADPRSGAAPARRHRPPAGAPGRSRHEPRADRGRTAMAVDDLARNTVRRP